MKIAIVGVRGIPHTYGGGDEFVRYFAPRLAEKGHKVIVYCWKNMFTDREKYYQGVERIFLQTINHKALGQLFHSFFCVIDILFRKVDIAYIHTLPSGPHTLILWLFKRALGLKIVVNTDGFDWLRDKWGTIGKLYFKLSARIVVFTADQLVSDAEGMREFYLKKFKRDSPVIAYGANVEKSEEMGLIQEFGVTANNYYLIACRFVPENNILKIIKAFEKVKTEKILLIAGSANYRSKYILECRTTKDPRIKFIGHIGEYNKVKELHCNCYAYVHGHSLGGTNPSLLKALGYGNCVIALNSVFNREVLQDNKYGILFEDSIDDIYNKIQSAENNPEMVNHYRGIAPQRILDAYTWDKITQQYVDVFSALCAKR